jgi:hypothetical protein
MASSPPHGRLLADVLTVFLGWTTLTAERQHGVLLDVNMRLASTSAWVRRHVIASGGLETVRVYRQVDGATRHVITRLPAVRTLVFANKRGLCLWPAIVDALQSGIRIVCDSLTVEEPKIRNGPVLLDDCDNAAITCTRTAIEFTTNPTEETATRIIQLLNKTHTQTLTISKGDHVELDDSVLRQFQEYFRNRDTEMPTTVELDDQNVNWFTAGSMETLIYKVRDSRLPMHAWNNSRLKKLVFKQAGDDDLFRGSHVMLPTEPFRPVFEQVELHGFAFTVDFYDSLFLFSCLMHTEKVLFVDPQHNDTDGIDFADFLGWFCENFLHRLKRLKIISVQAEDASHSFDEVYRSVGEIIAANHGHVRLDRS